MCIPNNDGGLPRKLSGKESTCQAGDLGSIPGSGRSPGERNGNPLQYSCLGNPMDRGAWRSAHHGMAKQLVTTEWLSNNKGGKECIGNNEYFLHSFSLIFIFSIVCLHYFLKKKGKLKTNAVVGWRKLPPLEGVPLLRGWWTNL